MIPLNDFKAQWREIGADALAAAERVGLSGWYVLGKEVERFEMSLAAAWGIGHAVGVGNGLDAIEIGLRCLSLEQGGKVLTTPLSAFATTLAIMRCGGSPVFVDTDENGLLDLGLCREALVRDPTIRFLLPVHLYGHPLNLRNLDSLREEFNLRIVEDCAQAIAARWEERSVGTIGQVAAVSLYPTKNLGALGDGGAVLTSNDKLAAHARALRHYGQSMTYVHDEIGMNSRLDELHAAILADALLPRLTAWTRRRTEIARTYLDSMKNIDVLLPTPHAASNSVWHLFPVVVRRGQRTAFRDFLSANGVMTGVHYPRLIPDQKALQKYGRFEVIGPLDRARSRADGEVSLPIHPFLSDNEVDRIASLVSSWHP